MTRTVPGGPPPAPASRRPDPLRPGGRRHEAPRRAASGPVFLPAGPGPGERRLPGSWVYLVCLDPPIAHPEPARTPAARTTPGSPGTCRPGRPRTAPPAAPGCWSTSAPGGGTWHIARTLDGRPLGRSAAIKDGPDGPRCAPTARPGTGAASPPTSPAPRRAARRSGNAVGTRSAGPAPDAPLPRLPAPPPAEQGRRAGERFLATREGWPADRLAAALAYVTGPYRQNGPRTPRPPPSEMAAFTATVTAGIQAQRATERAQPAPTAQQKGTAAVSTTQPTDRARARAPTEREKGAATARLIVTRQIEAGHSRRADRRPLGSRPGRARPADSHAGAASLARRRPRRGRQLIQDWRDMQRERSRAGPGRAG